MLNFIFRTDVHVSDNSPSSWKGDYPAEIWSDLKQIGALAKKHDCTAVLDGGDYFHVKAPTRNSHALVAKSAVIHSDYPCPVYIVTGNHDVKHNNLDTLPEQPLGVLLESGVFLPLVDQTFERDGVVVRVVGVPYNINLNLATLRGIRKGSEDYLVVVAHTLASKKPPAQVEDFFGEPVFKYEDLIRDKGPDIWLFGHWHQDQGIEVLDDVYFVNQGSVSRGSLVRENLTRIPKVALLSFDKTTFSVTPIELDVLPASEVFDLEKKERRDQESKTIETFVDKMRLDLLSDSEISLEDAALSIDSDLIGKLAVEYLRRARKEA
jgi:DNA repair exonuclease SbcCD nuclease subunit